MTFTQMRKASALFAARPGVRMLAMPEVYMVQQDDAPLEAADWKPPVLAARPALRFAASFDDEVTD